MKRFLSSRDEIVYLVKISFMGNNSNTLHDGRKNKNDEFYTCFEDIENELANYSDKFVNKTVYCNCDDPLKSNFTRYFLENFKRLGLNRLISSFYCVDGEGSSYALIYDGQYEGLDPDDICRKSDLIVPLSADDGFDTSDIETSWKNGAYGAGDFRSYKCVSLLKDSDIVVTNPPFSLFRDLIKLLTKYDKKYLLIGNTNVITYKEIFPLIKEGKLWLGCTNFNVGMMFIVPDSFERFHHIDENGNKIARVSTSCWWTNINNERKSKSIKLEKSVSDINMETYDDYDAVNVDNVKDIPSDYYGKIGVPITFLNKHNPEQFDIVGKLVNGSGEEFYDFGPPIVNGKMKYARLIIQRKKPL